MHALVGETFHSYNTNEWAWYDTTSGRKNGSRGRKHPSGAHVSFFGGSRCADYFKSAPRAHGTKSAAERRQSLVKLYEPLKVETVGVAARKKTPARRSITSRTRRLLLRRRR